MISESNPIKPQHQAFPQQSQLQEIVAKHMWSKVTPDRTLEICGINYTLTPFHSEQTCYHHSNSAGSKHSDSKEFLTKGEVSYFTVRRQFIDDSSSAGKIKSKIQKMKENFLYFLGLSKSNNIEKALLREGIRPTHMHSTCTVAKGISEQITRSTITRDALNLDSKEAFTKHDWHDYPAPDEDYEVPIYSSFNDKVMNNMEIRQQSLDSHNVTTNVKQLESTPVADDAMTELFNKSTVAYRCPISGEKLHAANAIHLTVNDKVHLLSRTGVRFMLINDKKIKKLELRKADILSGTFSQATTTELVKQSPLQRLARKINGYHSVNCYGFSRPFHEEEQISTTKTIDLLATQTPPESNRESDGQEIKGLDADSASLTNKDLSSPHEDDLKYPNLDVHEPIYQITVSTEKLIDHPESDSGVESSGEQYSPQLKHHPSASSMSKT